MLVALPDSLWEDIHTMTIKNTLMRTERGFKQLIRLKRALLERSLLTKHFALRALIIDQQPTCPTELCMHRESCRPGWLPEHLLGAPIRPPAWLLASRKKTWPLAPGTVRISL